MEITLNLSDQDLEELYAFAAEETKIEQEVADEYEAEGNMVLAESYRREKSLKDWAYRAMLRTIMK